jgi:glycosyltransferase involved in cell wall biosynthesis
MSITQKTVVTNDKRLRVAHISPTSGGVANAAARLHLGLLGQGIDSHLFTSQQPRPDSDLPQVYALPSSNKPVYYADVLSRRIAGRLGLTGLIHISSLSYSFPGFDIVHLHGMDSNWFNLHALNRLGKKHVLVWTMHDKHLGTGACGYPEMWGNCERWRTGCGECPKAQASGWLIDSTSFVYKRKKSVIGSSDIAIISLNNWMTDFVKSSPITKNQTLRLIPNGVDVNTFAPRPSEECRAELNLPAKDKLLLAVATNFGEPRKGLKSFEAILGDLKIADNPKNCGLVLIGSGISEELLNRLRAILPVYVLGKIDDLNKLAKVYSAADLFVITSVIDNLPSVVLESFACGTPVAGFKVGGIPDMVIPDQSGVLADLGNTSDLALQISDLLRDDTRLAQMRIDCRKRAVQHYSLEVQASKHIEFYKYLISERHKSNGRVVA